MGINASIATDGSSTGESGSIGLGFAIPIDEVLPIIEQMGNGEATTHAAHRGLRRRRRRDRREARRSRRLRPTAPRSSDVTAGSPPATAGLKSGDVITKVDDQLITDADSLVATIAPTAPATPSPSPGSTTDKSAELVLDSD